MASPIYYDPMLTTADALVLRNLEKDIESSKTPADSEASGNGAQNFTSGFSAGQKSDLHSRTPSPNSKHEGEAPASGDELDIAALRAMRDPADPDYVPSLLQTTDGWPSGVPAGVQKNLLQPYTRWARGIVRHETDIVMLTHLIVYFTTSVPSAILLFRHFSYGHAILHLVMQGYYMGSYTLMMHQHIHQRGILAKKYALLDRIFPFITDPLMGHSFNTYYYHHVKHHHVEGNGPNDLSSTVRYQRDSVSDFLQYVGRFYFFIWLELPLYFVRKGRLGIALQAAASEYATYFFYYVMSRINTRATIFIYIMPLLLMRLGMMAGNWGQHALVDADEPDSDFRSSITLIDVPSNRFSFNDGYHTSHHLNPLRHWRDHPLSFLEQKQTYVKEGALVFHNIDFIMLTIRLLRKDYDHLARCLVPIGRQVDMTMEDRAKMLQRLTRKFSEEEIKEKFPTRA